MDDDALLDRIDELTHDEQELRLAGGPDGLDDTARARLDQLEREIAVLYDLRDRRRAARRAGRDPDEEQPRDPETVARYLQ